MGRLGIKTLFACAVLALPVSSITTPASAEVSGCRQARSFVHTVSAKITDALLSKRGRKQKFARVFRRYADLHGMANFALGRYARRLPKARKSEYYKLAENMVVHMLSSQMGAVKGRSYQIWKCSPKGAGYAINGAIVEANGDMVITVHWLLKSSARGLRVADLSVAHLWLTQQQRASFRTVMSRNNGDINALFAHMRKKSS